MHVACSYKAHLADQHRQIITPGQHCRARQIQQLLMAITTHATTIHKRLARTHRHSLWGGSSSAGGACRRSRSSSAWGASIRGSSSAGTSSWCLRRGAHDDAEPSALEIEGQLVDDVPQLNHWGKALLLSHLRGLG